MQQRSIHVVAISRALVAIGLAMGIALSAAAADRRIDDALTVAESNMRGVIRAGTDLLPADNVFNFVLTPSRPLSVLVIQGEGASPRSSLFFTTALGIGTTPPFRADVVTAAPGLPAAVAGSLQGILGNNVEKTLISMALWLPYLLLSARVNVTYRQRVAA